MWFTMADTTVFTEIIDIDIEGFNKRVEYIMRSAGFKQQTKVSTRHVMSSGSSRTRNNVLQQLQ